MVQFLTVCIKKITVLYYSLVHKKPPYKRCRTHLSIKALAESFYLPKGINCLF